MNPMQQYLLHIQQELEHDNATVEEPETELTLSVITPGQLTEQEKDEITVDMSQSSLKGRSISAYFLYQKTLERAEIQQAESQQNAEA